MTKETNLHKFIAAGVFVLLGILIFNSFYVFTIGSSLDEKMAEARELAKPAEIEIIKLSSTCADCFDADEIINALKDSDLKILDEKSLKGNSREAKKLIEKYGIEKLPNIVITGETDKADIQNFKKVDDALVFDAVAVPYEDAVTNEIVGKVSSILINDKNCEACADLGVLILNLVQNGVFIANEEELDFSDSRAKELISQLNIEKLPAVLLSKHIDAYPTIAQSLSQQGITENKGQYVIQSQAPYVETDTGKVRGLVELTMIDDVSCDGCYGVDLHKEILLIMGIAIDEEKILDITSPEGKDLIKKYDIEKVPTVILNGDLNAYEGFSRVWGQVGTIEDDGSYVFRKVEVLEASIVYKDLTTNKIIEPVQQQSQ
ncbi:MAG: hypothetical protein QF436_00545 [Candidatus Woesearchaeota archaeon]|jgi:hypothetical protein|nr:hypothetical protein [Candidatus Woesearchaeota archaeon]MDP7622587.1 hypothetical protein [Candidatus Woesearchaeota archaeon]HJN57299.1 hypothetical protein [Candidatus Woesearchaeota archaeon]|tara:strand:+ start:26953 stop:28077 length:1125 start_codon:yes stop_codon:yes gene_type:complete